MSKRSREYNSSDDSDEEPRPYKRHKLEVSRKIEKIIDAALIAGEIFMKLNCKGFEKDNLIEFHNSIFDQGHEIAFIEPKLVKLKMSEEEKKEKKKSYRNEYNQRPDVAKLREDEKKSEEKKRLRKEYSERKDVKERKALVTKAKREYLAICKKGEEKPDYDEFMEGRVPRVVRKKREGKKKPKQVIVCPQCFEMITCASSISKHGCFEAALEFNKKCADNPEIK